jgi:hypothetical protein
MHNIQKPHHPGQVTIIGSPLATRLHLGNFRKKRYCFGNAEIGKLACEAPETLDAGETIRYRGRAPDCRQQLAAATSCPAPKALAKVRSYMRRQDLLQPAERGIGTERGWRLSD